MSLLTPTIQNIPATIRVKVEVNRIKSAPLQLVDTMVKQWETAFDLMWTTSNGITPAMRVSELGTNAAEIFQVNAKFVGFLASILKDKNDALVVLIMAKVATIPPFTVHEDGTVTLD